MLRNLVRKIKRFSQSERNKAPGETRGTYKHTPLSHVLEVNEARIRQAFGDSFDLVCRRVAIGKHGSIAALVVHLNEMVNPQFVSTAIIERIVDKTEHLTDPNTVYTQIRDSYLDLTDVAETHDLHKVAYEIANGNTCILVQGVAKAIVCQTQGYSQREVSQPTTESTIRGSKEGLVESLAVNLSLIRRRIRNPNLRVEQFTIGEVSQTPVALVYIEGIANPGIVAEARQRLSRIKVDSIQESGQLEEFIEDAPLSPFPTLLRTERPDRVTGNLLEGRFAIITDGSPFALIAPATFSMFLTAPEDYFERFFAGSVIRLLRYLAFLLSLTLPSLYVAITTFHQELLPTPLILSIAAQRNQIPFPAVVEAILMEIVFELLREAGIRLPGDLRTGGKHYRGFGHRRSSPQGRACVRGNGSSGGAHRNLLLCYAYLQPCHFSPPAQVSLDDLGISTGAFRDFGWACIHANPPADPQILWGALSRTYCAICRRGTAGCSVPRTLVGNEPTPQIRRGTD